MAQPLYSLCLSGLISSHSPPSSPASCPRYPSGLCSNAGLPTYPIYIKKKPHPLIFATVLTIIGLCILTGLSLPYPRECELHQNRVSFYSLSCAQNCAWPAGNWINCSVTAFFIIELLFYWNGILSDFIFCVHCCNSSISSLKSFWHCSTRTSSLCEESYY